MSAANINSIPDSILIPDAPAPVSEPIVAQVEAPVEVAPVAPIEPPKAPEPDKLTSTRFAHLSKKEAALVKERESLKREQESFKAQQAEVEKYRKSWEMVNEIAELQKTDAIGAMKRAGFTNEDLMNFLASAEDTSTTEERAAKMARNEIEKFKSEQQALAEESNKKAQAARQAEEEQIITKFKSDINSKIAADDVKYEYLNFYGEPAQGIVYDTIASILADSGEMISIEEAMDMVESYYEEEHKALSRLKKNAPPKPAKTAVKVGAPEPTLEADLPTKSILSTIRKESKQFVDNKPTVKTLTNRAVASGSLPKIENLSPSENKQRVIEKYLSTLKR